ncbi:MAG: hypothetical protein U1E65_17965 [Myxococcota bacterium]
MRPAVRPVTLQKEPSDRKPTLVLRIGEGLVKAPRSWKNLTAKDLVREGTLTGGGPTIARRLAAPRTQISLLMLPAPALRPEATLIAMFEALSRHSAGVRLRERGTFRFDDGSEGAMIVLEVAPLPGFQATQLHVVTASGAHLFANVPVTAGAAALEEARAILASFELRPSA